MLNKLRYKVANIVFPELEAHNKGILRDLHQQQLEIQEHKAMLRDQMDLLEIEKRRYKKSYDMREYLKEALSGYSYTDIDKELFEKLSNDTELEKVFLSKSPPIAESDLFKKVIEVLVKLNMDNLLVKANSDMENNQWRYKIAGILEVKEEIERLATRFRAIGGEEKEDYNKFNLTEE